MDDASGKFVLVMLRADQVRVHHKKTKHEYKFHVSGDPPEVGMCALHPNPAAPIDPRNYREDARGGRAMVRCQAQRVSHACLGRTP